MTDFKKYSGWAALFVLGEKRVKFVSTVLP